jgi:predicted peptidase
MYSFNSSLMNKVGKYDSRLFLPLRLGVLTMLMAAAIPAKAANNALPDEVPTGSSSPFTPTAPREASMPKEPYQGFIYTDATGATLPYLLFVPDQLEPGKKYPLVLFFHGSGERGDDDVAQLRNGIWVFTKKANLTAYPAFVLAPQCPKGKQWVDMPWNAQSGIRPPEPSVSMALALTILDKVCAEQPIDTDRIYVAGLSMGGYAVWDCVTRFPEKFAAAVAVCGGGDEHTVTAEVAQVPIWAFASDDDPIVPVNRSRGMVAAMKTAGGHPHYTEYHGYNHASWGPAFNERELMPWLFAQMRGKPDTFPWQAPLDLEKQISAPKPPAPAPVQPH